MHIVIRSKFYMIQVRKISGDRIPLSAKTELFFTDQYILWQIVLGSQLWDTSLPVTRLGNISKWLFVQWQETPMSCSYKYEALNKKVSIFYAKILGIVVLSELWCYPDIFESVYEGV